MVDLKRLRPNISTPVLYCTKGGRDAVYRGHITLLPDGDWIAWVEWGRRTAHKLSRTEVISSDSIYVCNSMLSDRLEEKLSSKKGYQTKDGKTAYISDRALDDLLEHLNLV